VELSYRFTKEHVTDPEIVKNPEGFAAVNLYTQEWDQATESLYYIINGLLRDTKMEPQIKWEKLKPFHQYINLLMSRLSILPKFKGTVYRGIKLDLRKVFKPNSIHIWWNVTSCTDTVSGIAEFLDTQGPRTFLDIYTYHGVKISEHSIYPQENEILLPPGTVLKVIDQLDLGNGLVAVQMHEIPSQTEIAEILFNDKEAIEFWNKLASEKFEVPLEDFCEEMLKRFRLPVIKSLIHSDNPSHYDIEGYKKYWGLWLFSGGDEQTFSDYTKNPLNQIHSECTISYHRFGLLLAWFGNFGKLLNELFTTIQRKTYYDDKMSSVFAAHILKQNVNTYPIKDLWLIRCSPKRDFPYVLTYVKTDGNIHHQRITFNPGTHQYVFQNFDTKKTFTHESIVSVVDEITRQYNLGMGFYNDKFKLINDPESVRMNQFYVPLNNVNQFEVKSI